MDRFIVSPTVQQVRWLAYLKSNMDRFIGRVKGATAPLWVNLKSNMDRFIVGILIKFQSEHMPFKIQYG